MKTITWRVTFVGLLAGGVVGAAVWVVFYSPVLGVREIQVTGNSELSTDQVRLAAGVPTGTPLASVDLDEVDRRVGALRQVESARADRGWPGTLRVEIVERTPVAAVPMGAKSAIVDRFGVVLSTVTVAPPRLPVLRVARLGPQDPATRSGLAVLGALPEDLLVRVRDVSASSAQSVTLRLTDGRTVVWGDARRSVEKARILMTLLGKPADVYDVSSPDVVSLK